MPITLGVLAAQSKKTPFALTPIYTSTQAYGGNTSASLTFTSIPLGAVASIKDVRYTVVTIGARRSGGSFSYSSVILNGNAMSQVIANGGNNTNSAIYIIDTTAWGNATVSCVVNTTASMAGARITAYNLTNPLSPTAYASFATTGRSGGTQTLSLNIAAGGAAVGVTAIQNDSGLSTSWSGLTQYVGSEGIGESDYASMGYGGSSGFPYPISVTSSDASPQGMRGCSASWAPGT